MRIAFMLVLVVCISVCGSTLYMVISLLMSYSSC
jgi:hypothetical protein